MSKSLGEPIRLPHPSLDQIEYLEDLIVNLKPSEEDLKRKIVWWKPKRRHNGRKKLLLSLWDDVRTFINQRKSISFLKILIFFRKFSFS